MKIEKKYLLRKSPGDKVKVLRKLILREGYYLTDEANEISIKSAHSSSDYTWESQLTFKKKAVSQDNSEEITIPINKELFLKLAKGIPLIEKTRETVFLYMGSRSIPVYIDSYFVRSIPAVCVVEFSNEEIASRFTPPDWFGEEVTEKEEHTSRAIWKKLYGKE